MYTSDNCKILNKDYIDDYKNAFREYFIQVIYGNNIVMGSTLIKDGENDE